MLQKQLGATTRYCQSPHHQSSRAAIMLLAAVGAVPLLSGSPAAGAYQWDPDAVTSGLNGGDGTWSRSAANWTTDSGVTHVGWSDGNTADIAGPNAPDGTTWNIVVDTSDGLGPITTSSSSSIKFARRGYLITGSAAGTTISTANKISISSGVTATVGNNLTLAATGTASFDNASGNSNGVMIFDTGSAYTATNNVSVNAVDLYFKTGTTYTGSGSNQLIVGTNNSKDLGALLVVDGASVTTAGTGLALATGSSTNLSAGVITLQNGGTIDLTSTNTSRGIVQFGSTNATFTTGHSTGTFNLDGGMLTAGQIVQGSTDAAISSTFNFNGGTLKVKADTALGATFMAGLSQANVKAGGAKIDTNGVDITIAQNLQHDATLGTLADGGLTKQGGTGTLILAGANSYTGATTISAGTLKLASTGTIDDSSAVNVAAGATFDISAKAGGYTVNGLGGGGTITAGVGQTLTLSASGALTPGNSIGTLLVSNGNLMLESGATYAMEIEGSTAAPENDRVDLLGAGSTILLDGNYTLDLSRIGTLDPTGMSFVLFDADAPIASPGAWSIDYGTTGWTGGQVLLNPGDNTQLILTGVSVPEPTSLTLLGALGAGLLSRRRRRC